MSCERASPLWITHEAMATTFRLAIAGADNRYARQAAEAAFAELDRIEACLSRYVEHADVARLNRLGAGQSLVVQPETLACLAIAVRVQQDTQDAFDVTYGSAAGVGRPRLRLMAAEHAVTVLADGVRVDLGGIGKGFALDRMAAVLAEWDLEAVLLAASTSTVLALQPPPGEAGWPVVLGPDRLPPAMPAVRHARLRNMALSGSGTGQQGEHIFDPRSGRPARGAVQAWAAAPTAAEADALSTAFMVLSADGVRDYCRRRSDVSAWLRPDDGPALLTVADRLG